MSDVVQRVASPKGRVESEELPKQLRDDVLDAVESLGGRCTVGDVAAAAGCKVSDAERALTAVAADTLAALEVSAEGDLLYVFPDGGRVRGTVAAKSARIRVFEPALETIGKVGSYLARVTFGTTLLASIAIVYAAIFALLSSKDSDRDDRRSSSDSGGGMMFGGPRFYISPFDYLWYWDPYYYERRAYMAELEGARDMNFLEAVFSFVFGDGDPNRDFERRRWALVGLCIQKTAASSPPSSSRRSSTATRTASGPTTVVRAPRADAVGRAPRWTRAPGRFCTAESCDTRGGSSRSARF